MVWDEGDTILRSEQIAAGADRKTTNAEPEGAEQADERRDAWPFTTRREGHPPLAYLLVAFGSAVAPAFLDPLTQARFAPILWFALATGALVYRLQRQYQTLFVSLVAAAALMTMPRLFAHAHFATLDAPLTAAWIFAWAAFGPACRDWRLAPLFGVALGLAMSAKFTGWLAPVPLAVWAVFYRDRWAAVALAIGLPIAVAVFVALNPPLWSAPVEGLHTFFELNLNRGQRPEHNISTLFFGRMYNLDHPLPWYNTLAWTAITISPMPLFLGSAGIWLTVRSWRRDPAGMLLVCNWATLVLARAFPGTPPHDAERLILPSFAFFAALVGVGTGRAVYRATLLSPPGERIVPQGWALVVIVLALLASTFDSVSYFPHALSYYNRLIGGLRGATALGMEPTYYWDALDRRALDWLNAHTAADEKIAFEAAPPANLALLRRWGWFSRLPSDEGAFRWYVVQRRPSAAQAWDLWLFDKAEPAYEITCSGVPLLDVYSYNDYQRARSATSEGNPSR